MRLLGLYLSTQSWYKKGPNWYALCALIRIEDLSQAASMESSFSAHRLTQRSQRNERNLSLTLTTDILAEPYQRRHFFTFLQRSRKCCEGPQGVGKT